MHSLLVALTTFATITAVSAIPSALVSREDWKTKLGWDGKVTTPAELDPKNSAKANTISPAAIGGVYFCTDANFQGRCVDVSGFNSGDCVGVGPDFNDQVSSFGPDCGLTCTIFSDGGCTGRATGGIVCPGIYNLADYGNNDAMSSFRCTN